MKSTRRFRGLVGMLACLVPFLLPSAFAADNPIPRPAALERDVQFWIRVYTQINTNAGYLHDENNLSVIYETMRFDAYTTQREREHAVDAARERYVAALKRIAFASAPFSDEDKKIRALWGDEATPIRLLEATNHIRFQLGQADRFREGLVRAGQWETHIAETLANLGLPPELAVLPHVESSFNPAAYSKVGAAGLWQFMRSTGRRYMRIDSTVDDRLDPFRATESAAQLLSYNYRLLGTWPLAITAYNHGAEGMLRAREQTGTDDIGIVTVGGPPVVSTGMVGIARRGQGSIDLRLGTLDRERDAVLRRPAEGEHTCEGRGCYRNVSQTRLHHGSHSTVPCQFFKTIRLRVRRRQSRLDVRVVCFQFFTLTEF